MCKSIVKEIHAIEDIQNVLRRFSDSLTSLSKGSEYRKKMAQKFATYGKVIIVSDIEEKIVGFAAFYCNDTISCSAYISMIAIDGRCKRKGYGQQLIDSIIKISKEKGMKNIRLEVNKKNCIAIKFYLKMGFSIVQDNAESYFMEIDIKENE